MTDWIDDVVWVCPSCQRTFLLGHRLRGSVCGACYERARRADKRHKHHHTCQACGGDFTTTRTDALYCSGACRQRAHRSRATIGPDHRNALPE